MGLLNLHPLPDVSSNKTTETVEGASTIPLDIKLYYVSIYVCPVFVYVSPLTCAKALL